VVRIKRQSTSISACLANETGQDLVDFSGCELIGLPAIPQSDCSHLHCLAQSAGNDCGRLLSGSIAVKHQDGRPKVLLEKTGLRFRKTRSHERDHVPAARLPQFGRIEEALLDDDRIGARLPCAMKLKS
jgi:hypothetical protein